MISLEKFSGLPIEMKDDYSLEFGEGINASDPSVREFSAMKPYLKDMSADYHRKGVYYMYRDLALDKDKEKVVNSPIQYDITVIPPGKFDDEFAKTIGHYHSVKPGTDVRYPEIYEVIYGQVFWVIQKTTPNLEQLTDVYIVEAGRGDKVIVPPGFGHVSVNPIDEVLVMANWQPRANQSTYESYESHQGAAYYVVESAKLSESGQTSSGHYEFVPNLNYNSLPELKRVRARELPQFGLRSALPMYFTALQDLQSLEFLYNPEKFLDELDPDRLFLEIK